MIRCIRSSTLGICALALSSGLPLADAQRLYPVVSGVTVSAHGVTLQVDALLEDVLRMREWRGTAVLEDAPWAVLPASRTSSVHVTVKCSLQNYLS